VIAFLVSGILIIGAAFLLRFSITTSVPDLENETATLEPTKFAWYVPPATPTPTRTLPSTRTATPTRANTLTRTTAPSRTATQFPTPTFSATPTVVLVNVGEKFGVLAAPISDENLSELSLAARGFVTTSAMLGFMDYTGAFDEGAPQLYRIFTEERVPAFLAAYQVYNWDAACKCRSLPVTDPPVTLISASVRSGETLRLPRSSYYIGNDFQALVLYADPDRITLNYTRESNPVRGYTLYLEGLAVDSMLLASYRSANATGRANLPAIQAGQGLGIARGSGIKFAIRDAGGFMDPRSRKDWWHGK
jgi:hypothetical protein